MAQFNPVVGGSAQSVERDKQFLLGEKIKTIDKNLDPIEFTKKIEEILDLMASETAPYVQAYFKMIKEIPGITSRDIESYRKDLNRRRALAEKEKKAEQERCALEWLELPPKALSPEEKSSAIAFLQRPDLISQISRDIEFAGDVVGEETNRLMLYLAAVSRKFMEPISLVIFGQSSSGKSYLANTISEFIPPEDRLVLSSVSPKALNYMGHRLKHKFILVQEWEGIENVLPTIRVLQSEGRLSHLVPRKNPDTNEHETAESKVECPCSVVITTTRAGIHDENSTRIFELHTDESISQTERVVKENLLAGNFTNRGDDAEKERIRRLHRNAQRLLEPMEVNIPYAQHLSFPSKTTRNRRDSKRFLQLIKAVAFLRQKQKETKKLGSDTWYIDADLDDYEIAYRLGIKVIKSTLDQISERARNVLKVCCELDQQNRASGKEPWFTVRDVQETGSRIGVDISNRANLYKQLNQLTEYEFLELDQPKSKGRKLYRLSFKPERDECGEIINIRTPEVKENYYAK